MTIIIFILFESSHTSLNKKTIDKSIVQLSTKQSESQATQKAMAEQTAVWHETGTVRLNRCFVPVFHQEPGSTLVSTLELPCGVGWWCAFLTAATGFEEIKAVTSVSGWRGQSELLFFGQNVQARHSKRKTFSMPGYKATFSQPREAVV